LFIAVFALFAFLRVFARIKCDECLDRAIVAALYRLCDERYSREDAKKRKEREDDD
jgi:hypothetical protein